MNSSSQKTRQALIDAAGQLAAEKGFNSISTRQIAELSGENIGSIHYHFGGKQQLFTAVVETVAARWQQKPLKELLDRCDLSTPAGQAEAIAITIRREISLLFDEQVPDWHCRVFYQLLHYADPLQEVFHHAVIGPESDTIIELIQRIQPAVDATRAFQYLFLIIAPLTLHVDYRAAVLTRIGEQHYPQTYIDELSRLCIRQALFLLNLPQRSSE